MILKENSFIIFIELYGFCQMKRDIVTCEGHSKSIYTMMSVWPASEAQSDAHLTGDQEVAGLTLTGWQHSFVEIDHEMFSMVILSLPLIQEGQLSVSGKRMCISTC